MRILVAGQSKTGTSALWSAISQSLPAGYCREFEVLHYRAAWKDVLLKLIVGTCEFAGTVDFEKRILIVRDPRDSLISRLMYAVYDMYKVYRDPHRWREWLETVERKCADPRSINTHDMMGRLESLAKDHEYMVRAIDVYNTVCNWDDGGWLVLRYEDFLAGDWVALEDYLGFALDWDGEVWPRVKRVVRRKRPGAWRHWFTPADVAYYRPIFAEYMARYGYGDDWALAKWPVIERQYTVEFVKRLLRERGARLQ